MKKYVVQRRVTVRSFCIRLVHASARSYRNTSPGQGPLCSPAREIRSPQGTDMALESDFLKF